MTLQVPTPIPDAGQPLPVSEDLDTWPARMLEMHRWMREDLAPGANVLASGTYQNALHSQTMAAQAEVLADFKGAWAFLTGALAGPATVYHVASGYEYWVLLYGVADVTAHQPGVSGVWVPYVGASSTAADLEYDHTASGLLADNVQAAIDEVYAKSQPTGAVVNFARNTAPVGFLKANGSAVSVTAYAALDAAIYVGDALNPTAPWGYRCTDPLNPTTTRSIAGGYIVLLDMRGEFPRGWDDGRGTDPGRAFGSAQVDDFKSHTHVPNALASASNSLTGSGGIPHFYANTVAGSTGATGGTETRPRNIALLACIKY
jgi:hypothetical protein